MVKESPSNLPFVEVWRRTVFESKLHPAVKCVAFGMAIHMNADGTSSRAGVTRLSHEVNVHPRSVKAARQALLDGGFIELVARGGSLSGHPRLTNEYRAILPDTSGLSLPVVGGYRWQETTGGEKLPVARDSTTGGEKSKDRWRETTQGRQESKAIEEEGAPSSKFCGKCDRGWIQTPKGEVRCECFGGHILSTNNDTESLLENIDELIAPPPPGLTRRTREAPPF